MDAHESAYADKNFGGGCIATLERINVDPVVERALDPDVEYAQSPVDDAQRVKYSFLGEGKESAVAPKDTLLIPRETLRGISAASSITCTSWRRMKRSQS